MAFTTVLAAIAASVALMRGVIGIFGVVSSVVTERTGELGVRLALGAEPAAALGWLCGKGLVGLAGIAIGLPPHLSGGRLIESLLYGVSSCDPGGFAVTIVTRAVALLACWLPARLNPLDAVRAD
jgi:ABC-type antimicrobial peptide transport system permease subunit